MHAQRWKLSVCQSLFSMVGILVKWFFDVKSFIYFFFQKFLMWKKLKKRSFLYSMKCCCCCALLVVVVVHLWVNSFDRYFCVLLLLLLSYISHHFLTFVTSSPTLLWREKKTVGYFFFQKNISNLWRLFGWNCFWSQRFVHRGGPFLSVCWFNTFYTFKKIFFGKSQSII